MHFIDRFKPQYGRDEDGEYLTLVKNLEPWEPKNEDSEDLDCMLPLTKSKKLVLGDWGVGTKGEYGFNLPGHGTSYEKCDEWVHVGCLEHDPVYIELTKSSCLRASCPVCYEKWAAKEAHSIEYRLNEIEKKSVGLGVPKHFVVSVPLADWLLVEKDYPKLRRKVYQKAFNVGIKGGCSIFHPFRRKCRYCGSTIDYDDKCCHKCGSTTISWIFSPHFHMIGYGFVNNTENEYLISGYVIINLGRRESIFSTAFYQLSHAGVNEKYHTVTWFGVCAYNKAKIEPEIVIKRCPICNGRLKPVKWIGGLELYPLPIEEGSYKVDRLGWIYCGWADKNYIMGLEVTR